MSKQTQEFETWLATGAKYGTAWEAWQHQAARIAELEAQVQQLQRVPLSDGRLVEAIESFTGFISGDVDKFVAHIESAHGITQEKQG